MSRRITLGATASGPRRARAAHTQVPSPAQTLSRGQTRAPDARIERVGKPNPGLGANEPNPSLVARLPPPKHKCTTPRKLQGTGRVGHVLAACCSRARRLLDSGAKLPDRGTQGAVLARPPHLDLAHHRIAECPRGTIRATRWQWWRKGVAERSHSVQPSSFVRLRAPAASLASSRAGGSHPGRELSHALYLRTGEQGDADGRAPSGGSGPEEEAWSRPACCLPSPRHCQREVIPNRYGGHLPVCCRRASVHSVLHAEGVAVYREASRQLSLERPVRPVRDAAAAFAARPGCCDHAVLRVQRERGVAAGEEAVRGHAEPARRPRAVDTASLAPDRREQLHACCHEHAGAKALTAAITRRTGRDCPAQFPAPLRGPPTSPGSHPPCHPRGGSVPSSWGPEPVSLPRGL